MKNNYESKAKFPSAFLGFLMFVFISSSILGQYTIPINDGSFEMLNNNFPDSHFLEHNWKYCKNHFPHESPPDVHNIYEKLWDVQIPPKSGNQFVGLVTRNTDSYESIGQKLESYLIPEESYTIFFSVAQSSKYLSGNRMTGQLSNYNHPTKLQIYLGHSNCGRDQLIFNEVVTSIDKWETKIIRFNPDDAYDHIIFQAYYPENISLPSNGNVLIDAIGNITLNIINPETKRNQDAIAQKTNEEIRFFKEFAKDTNLQQISSPSTPNINAYLLLSQIETKIKNQGNYTTVSNLTFEELLTVQEAVTFLPNARQINEFINEILNIKQILQKEPASAEVVDLIENIEQNNILYKASKIWDNDFIENNYELLNEEIRTYNSFNK